MISAVSRSVPKTQMQINAETDYRYKYGRHRMTTIKDIKTMNIHENKKQQKCNLMMKILNNQQTTFSYHCQHGTSIFLCPLYHFANSRTAGCNLMRQNTFYNDLLNYNLTPICQSNSYISPITMLLVFLHDAGIKLLTIVLTFILQCQQTGGSEKQLFIHFFIKILLPTGHKLVLNLM